MNARLLIPVIWMLAGALIVKLWSAWDYLPDRVAVHFGMSMQPNGWSSKGTLAVTVILAVAGQAALATWLVLRLHNASNVIAAVQLVVSIVLVCAFWQVINYNAKGLQVQPLWILVPMVLLFATITLFFVRLLFHYYWR